MSSPSGAGLNGSTTTADANSGYAVVEPAGLPQFDTSIWAGQVVYLLFLFAVLYLLISRVFVPRLRRVMDERAETISSAVATARSVQAEAAAQAAVAKADVERARTESRAMATAAKARITAEANARRLAEEAEVSIRIEAAEARIGRTRDAAMANVSAIAVETAQAIVERLTGRPVTDAEAAAAVKGAT